MRDKLIELIRAGRGCPYNANKYSDGGKFCKSCEHSTDSPCWAGVIADYLIAHGVTIADVPDNNVGKWISVSERLPDEDGSYLVCALDYKKRPYVDCVYFAKRLRTVWKYPFGKGNRPGWYGFESADGYYEQDNVTHWMPLPEPPKEG